MSQTTRLGWCAAFALATALSLCAAVAPDTIQGSGGQITIQPVMHAAVQIRYGNQVITVDPTAMGGDYNTLPKADIVLVTEAECHRSGAVGRRAADQGRDRDGQR